MIIDKNAENDVLVGYCHNGSVAACFMDSVLGAFAEDVRRSREEGRRRLIEYYQAGGPYIHDNRSRIARYFLDCTDKQWLWMLDNDMDFPIDSLYRLLNAAEEHDCGILGAAYWNQYQSTDIYLSWLVFTPQGIKAVQALPEGRDPVEVSAVGMGCTLVHRTVLEDVAAHNANDPWDTFAADMLVQFTDGTFLVGRVPEDFEGLEHFNDRVVQGTQRMGEDVSMCLRARNCGHKTYGLPSLVAEHFKTSFMRHGSSDIEVRDPRAPKQVAIAGD